MRLRSVVLAAVLWLAGSVGVLAQGLSTATGLFPSVPQGPGNMWTGPQELSPAQLTRLAVNCNHCHAADGVFQQFVRSTGESHVVPPPLAGMPKDQIIARVNAFRRDESQAAAMHRVAKQYDEQQIRELAAYLAGQPAMR